VHVGRVVACDRVDEDAARDVHNATALPARRDSRRTEWPSRRSDRTETDRSLNPI